LVRLLLTSVVAIALLSACGKSDTPMSAPGALPKSYPVDKVNRGPILDAFPVLNQNGDPLAYSDPDLTGYPIGVMVGFKPDTNETALCSVSHLGSGYVTTNAHCLEKWDELGPAWFHVLYFDRQGLKRHARVESFVYVGSKDSDDVAVLKIPGGAAEQWEAAGKSVKQVELAESNFNNPRPLPIAYSVRIWAFDPIMPWHADVAERNTIDSGMMFQPRTCQMTRTQPTLIGNKIPENGPIKQIRISSGHGNQNLHFFLDQCDRNPVHGNSGSLVTLSGKFDDKIGVFHWMSGAKEGKDKYDYVEFDGSDGRPRFIHEEGAWHEIFGVGYLFQHFAGQHPNVLF